MKKEKYSSGEILAGIRNSDHKILKYIYDQYFVSVKNMVVAGKGTDDMADDVFQEALVVVYKKSKNEDFNISESSFFTYFYAICKYTFFRVLQNKSKDILDQSISFEESLGSDYEYKEEKRLVIEGLKEHLFHKYMTQLSKQCSRLLNLIIEGYNNKVIAEKLKMSSEAYVRKRKAICLKSLVKMIKKDPKSNELL